MKNLIIYFFPLVFDIIVSVGLFAGRHTFGERGLGTGTVGSISLIYGVVYIVSNFIIPRVLTPSRARPLMLTGVVCSAAFLAGLANVQSVIALQVLFAGIPFSASLFFNSFQVYMLGVDTSTSKPLATTIGHYTLGWSIGFALGPVISSLFKSWLSWGAVYYATAVIDLMLGMLVFIFKPGRQPHSAAESQPRLAEGTPAVSLSIAAWIGIIVGWGGMNMVLTLWPVHSETLGFSTAIKGTVEFVFVLVQGLSAWAYASIRGWQFKPGLLPLFALGGISGGLLFAFGGVPVVFIIGAVLFGLYSGAFFSYLPFHAMVEPDKAIHRVAVNEVCVGIAFTCGPLLANAVQTHFNSIKAGYLAVVILIAVGVGVQTWIASAILKRA